MAGDAIFASLWFTLKTIFWWVSLLLHTLVKCPIIPHFLHFSFLAGQQSSLDKWPSLPHFQQFFSFPAVSGATGFVPRLDTATAFDIDFMDIVELHFVCLLGHWFMTLDILRATSKVRSLPFSRSFCRSLSTNILRWVGLSHDCLLYRQNLKISLSHQSGHKVGDWFLCFLAHRPKLGSFKRLINISCKVLVQFRYCLVVIISILCKSCWLWLSFISLL